MQNRLRWIAAGIVAVFVSTIAYMLSPGPDVIVQLLLDARHAFLLWIAAHPVLGVAAFLAFAAGGMLTPFPSATLIQMIGGVAFGTLGGGVLAALGTSLSSALALLIGRTLFVGSVEKYLGARLAPARRAFGARPFHSMLTIRLFPGFPAWLSNLVPVPLPIPLPKVMLATFLGVLPICLTFSSFGNALGSLTAVENVSVRDLLNAQTVLPLVALFALSVASLIVRRRIERQSRPLPLSSPPELPERA